MKEQKYIYPQSFGAIGNSVHDDTQAIQAALDFAVAISDGKVYLPAGTYKITGTLTSEE